MESIACTTPIQQMKYDDGENTFFIKRDDLLPFSFGGSKVRIAEHYFKDLEAKGCNCAITYGGSRSNINRVMANMCKAKGLECRVVMSADEDGTMAETCNSRIIRQLGIEPICCDKSRVCETVGSVMDDCRLKGLKPYYIYGDIHGSGNDHIAVPAYIEAYDEIQSCETAAGREFDYIFHASATGITQSGLICGKLKHHGNARIVGISVARTHGQVRALIADNVKKALGCEGGAHLDENIYVEDRYICGGYGRYDDRIMKSIREVLNSDGIPLDTTYTGKAFWGMGEYLKQHGVKGARVLFIHTGGLPLFFDDIRNHEGL